MPTLYYRVEAPGVNILKTVSDTAIKGFLDELDLTTVFADAVYPMSSFMASSQYSNSNNKPTLIENRCDIDINYVMDKSQVPWPTDSPYTTAAYGLRSTTKGNHTPILIDQKAGILIEHTTVACALEMNFTLTFISFDLASKAFDTIQNRYKGSLTQTPFDLAFSYPVSMGMLEFLTAVYKAKTDYQSKSLLDYINDMKKTEISFDVRKSQLTSPTADKELMVRCQELNCVAQVTMEQKEPEVSKVDDLPDTYKLEFNVVLQFGRPNLIAVHTPVSIDNTVLPFSLFQSTITNFHYNPAVTGVYQDVLFNSALQKTMGNYGAAQRIVRLPVYDDWFSVDQQYAFYQYRPFLIAHFTLDGATTSFNLNQLDVQIHPIVKTILGQMANKVLDYGGLFTLGVYANNLRLGTNLVTMDADLNITITSNRPDKVYHLMLSETTSLFRMTSDWDELLIKYRYFFPMTIERNIQSLIKKRYFYIAYDDSFLTLIARLQEGDKLKALLATLITLGETDEQIYGYTQNPSQLADYLVYTPSSLSSYTLTTGTGPTDILVQQYYATKASVEGRSLFVAFMEQCLILGYITLDSIPMQYLEPNKSVYPYYNGQGGYYGFNSPLRVINYTINPQRNTQ